MSVAQQQAVIGSPPSLSQQRRCILPHPDALEHLTVADTEPSFALIPGAKNRSKNPIIIDLSEHYKKTSGPVMSLGKASMLPSKDPLTTLAMAG